MQKLKLLVLIAIITFAFNLSCDSGENSENDQTPTPTPEPEPDLENQFNLTNAFPNLIFDKPLDIQNSGDGTNRLFIVEQKGTIQVISNIAPNTQSEIELKGLDATVETFLDIQNRVSFNDSELGILGLAFHPNYANNGILYVNYTADNPLRSVISQFSTSTQNPNRADPNSEVVLLEIPQPHPFHNGGQLVFGPNDGYLYISMGDGGPPFGANGTSQDFTNLLGSIIRIDVDNPQGQLNYGIPPDNPFANNNSGFREELFAAGLRNPWRLAFDAMTGTLWTGDVGEFSREEINIIESGNNYGWPIIEGSLCFDPSAGCNFGGLVLPVHEYNRSQGGAVIGGIIYHGSEFTELSGLYIYGDFLSGRVWALEHDGTSTIDNTQLLQFDPFSIVAFGLDEHGEPYVASFDGNIYRLESIENSQ